MSENKVRIIKDGHSQRIFIGDYEVKEIFSYKLESDTDMNPKAFLTVKIWCEIEEGHV